MSTELETVSKALVDINAVSAGIADLNARYAGVVYEVATTKGMDEAKTARLAVRNPRFEVERIRKAAKAPILALGKKLDAEASRIEAALLRIEEPIDAQIKAEDARKDRERQAKIDAEIARVAEIDGRIEAIRRLHLRAMGKTSAHARAVLAEAEASEVKQDVFQEKTAIATEALEMALIAIRGIVVERELHESEQQRLKEEREELARLREAENVRLAAEAARRDEEERQAKAVRDEETRRHAEQLRQQREEQERSASSERQRIADEDARIAAERAEVARQQDALREAQKPQKAPAPLTRAGTAIKPPTASEIVNVLSTHYRARPDTVVEWLLETDFSDAAEAA